MKKKGFTLIEMLIVIVIIGILAAAIIPRITGVKQRARNIATINAARDIEQALDLYYVDHGTYPDTSGSAVCFGDYDVDSNCNWSLIGAGSQYSGNSEVYNMVKTYFSTPPTHSTVFGNNGGIWDAFYYIGGNEQNGGSTYTIAYFLDGKNISCHTSRGLQKNTNSTNNTDPNRSGNGLTLCVINIKNGK